eukprot:g261.t1
MKTSSQSSDFPNVGVSLKFLREFRRHPMLRRPMSSLSIISEGILEGSKKGDVIGPFDAETLRKMDQNRIRQIGREYRVFSDLDGKIEFDHYSAASSITREQWIARLNSVPTTTTQVNICIIKPATSDAQRRVFIWNDIFVEDQNSTNKPENYFFKTFKTAVGSIGHTLLVLHPWNEPIPLMRSWCIWEIYSTISTGAKLSIALPPSSRDAFRATLVEHFDTIITKMCAIDASEANALFPSTKRRIDATIRDWAGGFKAINRKIGDRMREWLCSVGTSILRIEDRRRGVADVSTKGTLIVNLAKLLFDLGKTNEAERLLRRALTAREKHLGDMHVDTISVVEILGALLFSKGRLDEAEPLLKRSLQFCKTTLGTRHLLTLKVMNSLARLLRYRGHLDEAELLMRETLKIRIEVLGPDNHDTLETGNNLARLLRYERKYDEAERVLTDVLRRRIKSLGTRHKTTLMSMNNMAGLLSEQKRYFDSERLYVRVVAGLEEVAGKEHRNTLNARGNLGVVRMMIPEKSKEGRAEVERVLASFRGPPFFFTASQSWIRKFERALADTSKDASEISVSSPPLPPPLLRNMSSTTTISSTDSSRDTTRLDCAISSLRKISLRGEVRVAAASLTAASTRAKTSS